MLHGTGTLELKFLFLIANYVRQRTDDEVRST